MSDPAVLPVAPLPEKPMSTGEWFVTLFVLALPFIGLIMLIVWALGEGNINRRNFCRASLLWFAVTFGLAMLGLITFLILGGTMAALTSHGMGR